MNAGPTIPDPVQNRPVSTPGSIPRPPKSTPPSAGPPQPADRPRLPTSPSLPGPTGQGAPSPFDHPEDRQRPDPTAVTTRGGKGRGALGAVVGAFVVLLVAAAGAGVWFFFMNKDPGTIELTTTPRDPVVRFDEVPVRATSSPFVIANVEPGTMHLLEVRKAGYRPWSMQVEVQPGQTLALPPVVLETESGEPATEEEEVAAAADVEGTGFTLETEPSGAKVFVDDSEIEARTPVQLTDLSPGSHSIRVENGARYAPWETQIQLDADQVIALPRVTLDLASVTVSFTSDPEGATVTLVRGSQRRNVGRTPTSADVDLTGDGTWTVEMTKSGHEPFSRELEPEAGEDELEFEATLTRRAVAVAHPNPRPNPRPHMVDRPQMMDQPDMAAQGGEGTLRVNTRPWSQVFVDGRLIGNTPQMNIPLSAGSHRLTLVNSDFNIRETINVQIRAGQVTTKIVTLTPGG
jgi:hypothetical protein